MSGVFRLPDEKALADLVSRSHVRVVHPLNLKEDLRLERPAKAVHGHKPPHLGTKQRRPRGLGRSGIEERMALELRLSSLPPAERQYRYLPERKFRADFAWPGLKVALEVDGGVHRIKRSFAMSFARSYLLLMAGWTVLHVGAGEVRNGLALKWITNLLASRSKTA